MWDAVVPVGAALAGPLSSGGLLFAAFRVLRERHEWVDLVESRPGVPKSVLLLDALAPIWMPGELDAAQLEAFRRRSLRVRGTPKQKRARRRWNACHIRGLIQDLDTGLTTLAGLRSGTKKALDAWIARGGKP